MTCLTICCCRNVGTVFTHGDYAVMASHTTTQHLAMVNPQCWLKQIGRMAGFTGIAAQYMGIALTDSRNAIMAIEAVITNF